MTVREQLEKMVEVWGQMGHPAILERFVLRNGREYEPVKRRIGRKMKDKECYSNSTQRMFEGVGTYVEGFAYRPGLIMVHHAWLAVDGKAMDPTWKDPEKCEYFGVEWTEEEVRETIYEQGYYGLYENGVGMINVELLYKRDPGLKVIVDEFLATKKTHPAFA